MAKQLAAEPLRSIAPILMGSKEIQMNECVAHVEVRAGVMACVAINCAAG
jgi:hypothetical protein